MFYQQIRQVANFCTKRAHIEKFMKMPRTHTHSKLSKKQTNKRAWTLGDVAEVV